MNIYYNYEYKFLILNIYFLIGKWIIYEDNLVFSFWHFYKIKTLFNFPSTTTCKVENKNIFQLLTVHVHTHTHTIYYHHTILKSIYLPI